MPTDLHNHLVIAISSRALFDLDESHQIYEQEGLESYRKYQISREDTPLNPGKAFNLVRKLLALNERLDEPAVEVILLSRNSADTGLRVFNSVEYHGLPITRAAFSGGESPYRYVASFGAHLFLSTDSEDVRKALEAGYAAASILSGQSESDTSDELKIAFDGDAVLFSDDSERIYQQQGLDAFTANEKGAANEPLLGGPFKPFLSALNHLQKRFDGDKSIIRTALVTARAAPAHERVVRTLRAWDIRIDESLFLGGLQKGEFLKAFGADIFFDDQKGHCDSAAEHVTAGHVPHGISNE